MAAAEAPRPAWADKVDLICATVCVGANPAELDLFLYTAERTGLDPLAKQIYAIKRGGRMTIQTGIDGFRIIAHRNGCAGIEDSVFHGTEGTFPGMATVTVYRMVQGQRCPFTASARWAEYYPGDSQGSQWRKMPHVMLGKVAEALALRKAFPADLSGLYTDEEMEQAGPITEAADPPPAAAPAKPAIAPQDSETAAKKLEAQDFLVSLELNAAELKAFQSKVKAAGWKSYEVLLEAKDEMVNDGETLDMFVMAKLQRMATPSGAANN